MTATVNIDRETKSKIEELQAGIKLRTGRKVTQQEVLSRLIQSAIDSRSEFIDSFRDGKVALTATEVEQFNEGRISSGIETTEEDIDDMLYR